MTSPLPRWLGHDAQHRLLGVFADAKIAVGIYRLIALAVPDGPFIFSAFVLAG